MVIMSSRWRLHGHPPKTSFAIVIMKLLCTLGSPALSLPAYCSKHTHPLLWLAPLGQSPDSIHSTRSPSYSTPLDSHTKTQITAILYKDSEESDLFFFFFLLLSLLFSQPPPSTLSSHYPHHLLTLSPSLSLSSYTHTSNSTTPKLSEPTSITLSTLLCYHRVRINP